MPRQPKDSPPSEPREIIDDQARRIERLEEDLKRSEIERTRRRRENARRKAELEMARRRGRVSAGPPPGARPSPAADV